ncbi:MAG: PilT/PilU family type 4a pilus ATPase [Rhodoglobus sp.]
MNQEQLPFGVPFGGVGQPMPAPGVFPPLAPAPGVFPGMDIVPPPAPQTPTGPIAHRGFPPPSVAPTPPAPAIFPPMPFADPLTAVAPSQAYDAPTTVFPLTTVPSATAFSAPVAPSASLAPSAPLAPMAPSAPSTPAHSAESYPPLLPTNDFLGGAGDDLDLSDSFAATMKNRRSAAEPVKLPTAFRHPDHDADLLAALDTVVELGGSDLHVTMDAIPMIRLHGALSSVPGATVWGQQKLSSALHSIMSEAQREIFDRELELDFAYTLTDDSRFRVNIYQQRGSMGAAFRLIPTEIKSLDELGVPESIGRFCSLSRGLVLITGPTGSGKSTTLAALIDKVNQERADHIVTVEDPIEFMHQNKQSLVNQREVGGDTHSFANALKHVLRQDPDVILIGELRDLETISVALTAAETGHLVFATLHTQSAAQTIDRIIDVFPPHQQGQVRSQLAATLQGVVCQTLVRSASGDGRVVATEVLIATPALSNLIREGKTFQVPSALQAGRDLGMHTMDQHLADLVTSGQITKGDALERAQNREDLLQLIQGGGGFGQFRGDLDSRAF